VLVGVAVGVLWVRSWRDNRRGDRFAFGIGQDRWEVRSQGGGLRLTKLEPWFFSGPSSGGKVVPRYNSREVLGIAYWILLAMTTVLPATRLIAWKRLRRRVANGLCLRCGYDLRASSGRCPECGDATSGGTPRAA
jgi:hypothetical protein